MEGAKWSLPLGYITMMALEDDHFDQHLSNDMSYCLLTGPAAHRRVEEGEETTTGHARLLCQGARLHRGAKAQSATTEGCEGRKVSCMPLIIPVRARSESDTYVDHTEMT
jgi:hypothetical protein